MPMQLACSDPSENASRNCESEARLIVESVNLYLGPKFAMSMSRIVGIISSVRPKYSFILCGVIIRTSLAQCDSKGLRKREEGRGKRELASKI